MKIKHHQSASSVSGVHMLVNSYSVGCAQPVPGGQRAHTYCVTQRGISWKSETAYPYSLVSGLQSLMVVRIPSSSASEFCQP